MVKWYVDCDFAAGEEEQAQKGHDGTAQQNDDRQRKKSTKKSKNKAVCSNDACGSRLARVEVRAKDSTASPATVAPEDEDVVCNLSFRIEEITSIVDNNLSMSSEKEKESTTAFCISEYENVPSTYYEISNNNISSGISDRQSTETTKHSFDSMAMEAGGTQVNPSEREEESNTGNSAVPPIPVKMMEIRRASNSSSAHDPAKRMAVVDLLDFDVNALLDGISDCEPTFSTCFDSPEKRNLVCNQQNFHTVSGKQMNANSHSTQSGGGNVVKNLVPNYDNTHNQQTKSYEDLLEQKLGPSFQTIENTIFNDSTDDPASLYTYSNMTSTPSEPMLAYTKNGSFQNTSPNLNDKQATSALICSAKNNNLCTSSIQGTSTTCSASSSCHGSQCYPSKHPKLGDHKITTGNFASSECEPYYIADIPTFRFNDKMDSSKQPFPNVLHGNRNLLLESLLRTLSSEAWQLESTSPARSWTAGPRYKNFCQTSSPDECQVESKSLLEILESSLNVAPEPKQLVTKDESVRKAPPKSALKRLGTQDYERLRLVNRGRRWKNVNCVARALYDNSAESPDELAFRRGDLLTVLEQNTAGLEGWWLCSLKGRQGICPGNRLRIVPGCYDTGTGVPCVSGGPRTPTGLPIGAQLQQVASQQQHGPTVARTQSGNKVVTPKRIGDIYTYDTPRRYPGAHTPTHPSPHPTLDYDVPPSRTQPYPAHGDGSRLSRSSSLRHETPRHILRGSFEHHDMPLTAHDPNIMANTMHYDIPRSQALSSLYDSPRPQMAYGVPLPYMQDPSKGGLPSKSLIKGVRGAQTTCVSSSAVNRQTDSDAGQYDVPKPIHEQQQNLEVPAPSDRSSGVSIMSCDSTSSSASSIPASESPYLSSIGGSSNRSSLDVQDAYDIPPEPRKVGSLQKPRLPPRENQNRSHGENRDVGQSQSANNARGEGVYDVPPQVSRDARNCDAVDMANQRVSSGSDCSCTDVESGAGLPLEYDSATDMLAKLQQDVQCALEKLANFNAVTSPTNKSVTDERFEESKVIIERLKNSLQEFIKFSEGSSVNSTKYGNEKLAKTLHKQIDPLTSTYHIINNSWSCAQNNKDNAMDVTQQLNNITKPLGDNVRQITILIQTNANFLFKRTPSIEQTKPKSRDEEEKTPVQDKPTQDGSSKKTSGIENLYANETAFLEDYDYVKLESKESVEREHQQIKESLPTNLRKSYDNLVKQSHFLVDNDHQKALSSTANATSPTKSTNTNAKTNNSNGRLDANDRQVLIFYGNQAELHIQHLNTAIDAFFLTIEENQPPKVFIAHSKFVILSAHKLVFIGDTVHRNVVNSEVRTCVLNCSNALCDAMKNTVAAAKTAAIQFPSVTAVQAMVDSFATISHLACNLRNAICRL